MARHARRSTIPMRCTRTELMKAAFDAENEAKVYFPYGDGCKEEVFMQRKASHTGEDPRREMIITEGY